MPIPTLRPTDNPNPKARSSINPTQTSPMKIDVTKSKRTTSNVSFSNTARTATVLAALAPEHKDIRNKFEEAGAQIGQDAPHWVAPFG
jgi:hypothetical protein